MYSFVVSPDMCTGALPGAKFAKIALFILRGEICRLLYEYLIYHNYHLTWLSIPDMNISKVDDVLLWAIIKLALQYGDDWHWFSHMCTSRSSSSAAKPCLIIMILMVRTCMVLSAALGGALDGLMVQDKGKTYIDHLIVFHALIGIMSKQQCR